MRARGRSRPRPGLWWSMIAVAAAGCGAEPVPPEQPFRDDWVVEAMIPLEHTGPEGEVLVGEVVIGGEGTRNNFANRGDVVVLFDGPPDTMTVELRRFVMASNQRSADEQLAELELWAYDDPVEPPRDKEPDEQCLDGWSPGCELRVFADALSQREVAGADLRVTLPPDYRGVVEVQTEDASSVSDYLDRGDVCIDGLPGSADIRLQSGRVWVRVADDMTPTPTCPAADVAACEDFTVPDAEGQPVPAAWARECPCLAKGHAYGRVIVDSRNVDSTDVTVDVPADLWSAVLLENRLHQALDRTCTATLSLPDEHLQLDPRDTQAEVRGSINHPGYPAIEGEGYQVTLRSGTCGPVAFSEGPADFAGPDGEQALERRGDIELCSGCIEASCDALVP